MPYAENAGVRIHYEVDGTGPPLVLQHGFTMSSEDWRECGYVTGLRSEFQLIMIDARGHGGSDKPHDESSYTLDRRTADVTSVLDAIGVEKSHFWGYSMGGWIGFGMARYAPSRLNALVIGGAQPFARDQAGFRQWINGGIAGGGDAFVSAFERMAGPIPATLAARLRTADLHAFLAASQDRPAMEDILRSMAMPCCIYAGDADPLYETVKLASERLPNARFVALPGLSHIQAFVESDVILPPVMKFLQGR